MLLILTLTMDQNTLADALSRMDLIDFVAAGRPLDLAAAVKPVSWKPGNSVQAIAHGRWTRRWWGRWSDVSRYKFMYGIQYQRRHLVQLSAEHLSAGF